MKKFTLLLVMLVFTVLSFSVIFTACSDKKTEEKSELRFAVITDTHVISASYINEDNYYSYSHEDKLVHISEATVRSLADELSAKAYDCVFHLGDLTEDGDEASHLVVQACLEKLKKNGVPCFVINGNHDVFTDDKLDAVTPLVFAEIYDDFGYGQALTRDEKSLSYTADINDEYRLVAIDNTVHYSDETGTALKEKLSKSLTAWTKEQVDKAKEDGKKTIVICHDMLQNVPEILTAFENKALASNKESLCEYFEDKDVELVLSGHQHLQDATIADDVLYVVTSATCYTPCRYREVEFFEDRIDVKSVNIDYINESYLADCVTNEDKAELSKGLQHYMKYHFDNHIKSFVSGITEDNGFLGKVIANSDGDLKLFLNAIKTTVIAKAVNNPYYIKDEKAGEASLERIMQAYGLTLPTIPYVNAADFATYVMSFFADGDQKLNEEYQQVFVYTIFSAFYFLNEQSEVIASALPDYPKLNLNVEKLFCEGKLECYKSKIIPFALIFLSKLDNDLIARIANVIKSNFSNVSTLQPVVNGLTNNMLNGITKYFSNQDILLKELLIDGAFGKYLKDIVLDTNLSDNDFSIDRN